MNNKIIPTLLGIVLIISFVSGCFSTNKQITYISHATKISYQITYGYSINCSGEGKIKINYDCNKPDLLKGETQIVKYLNDEYSIKTIATYNDVLSWNITSNSCKDYRLGLTADILAESFIVSDLNGENALNINEIKVMHPDLISQYCNIQSNETVKFIDPTNSKITNLAQELYEKAESDNAFTVSKEIFKWLKKSTTYKTHTYSNNVQTALYTLEKCTGDCDDLSYLFISLCRSVNIPSRLIRGFLVEENSTIPHAWVEVFVGGDIRNNGWIPVECAGTAIGYNKIQTEIHQNFGLESANHLRLFIDDGSNESLFESQKGISYLADSSLLIEPPGSILKVNNYNELESYELHVDENNIRSYR